MSWTVQYADTYSAQAASPPLFGFTQSWGFNVLPSNRLQAQKSGQALYLLSITVKQDMHEVGSAHSCTVGPPCTPYWTTPQIFLFGATQEILCLLPNTCNSFPASRSGKSAARSTIGSRGNHVYLPRISFRPAFKRILKIARTYISRSITGASTIPGGGCNLLLIS